MSLKKEKSSKELKNFIGSFQRGKSLLSPTASYSTILKDKVLLAKAVRQGVPFEVFKEIKDNSPFDDNQWSDFLNINLRTLQRYRKTKDFVYKPLQSERIFELAEVVSLGNEVFDSMEEFNLWLETPSPALANEKPLDLLDSSYGKDLVIAELQRIDQGIFVL